MKKIIAFSIFFFIFYYSFSQTGQWTWVSGDNFIQSAGHYGTLGIPDTANYPPAVYEPCDWQDQEGNFWVFGGYSYHFNSNMADLWKYDPTTNEWTWMKGIGVVPNGADSGFYGIMGVPSPLNRPCGKGWGTPTWSDNNGNLWLYGGSSNSADLWKYDISANEWTWMQGTPWSYWWNPTYTSYGTLQVPSPTNTPGNRKETSTTWTDNDGNLWLFGGAGQDSNYAYAFFNDLWKFDVSLNQWVWMNGANYPNDLGDYGIKGVASPTNQPPARSAFAKWKDASGNFYFFGGFKIDVPGWIGYNDVWKYDISLNNWIWIGGESTINDNGSYSGVCITDSTNIPRNAFENRSTCFDPLGNVFMFGSVGFNFGTITSNTNEFFHYSIPHNEWTLLMQDSPVVWGTKGVASPTNAPPKTVGSLAWYRDNEVWLFGGSDYGNPNSYNCLWKYSIDANCFPTGIKENDLDEELNLFPNPFTTNLNVELRIEEQAEIILYDIASRKILQQTFIKSVSLNTEQLAKGIYFFEVKDKNRVVKKGKVVKN